MDCLSRSGELRRDVAAYTLQPLDEDELALADLTVEFDLDDGDVDYDALYGKPRKRFSRAPRRRTTPTV